MGMRATVDFGNFFGARDHAAEVVVGLTLDDFTWEAFLGQGGETSRDKKEAHPTVCDNQSTNPLSLCIHKGLARSNWHAAPMRARGYLANSMVS